MRTVAIIQARASSARLPGKVLMDIAGAPMLVRVVDRVRLCVGVDEVVVTTSIEAQDDPVAKAIQGCLVVRGSLTDVLDRYVLAARTSGAQLVMRVTGDCPLWNPSVGALVLQGFDPSVDYVHNLTEGTDGWDTEVFTQEALERAGREATAPADREHVTSYIRDSRKFSTRFVRTPTIPGGAKWSVDDAQDLERVRAAFAGAPS